MIGIRMTPRFFLFSGSFSWLFFVLLHLFSSETNHDFNNDIYGSLLRVELVAIIRKEIEFNQLDDLKAQLDKDSRATKKLLGKINYSI